MHEHARTHTHSHLYMSWGCLEVKASHDNKYDASVFDYIITTLWFKDRWLCFHWQRPFTVFSLSMSTFVSIKRRRIYTMDKENVSSHFSHSETVSCCCCCHDSWRGLNSPDNRSELKEPLGWEVKRLKQVRFSLRSGKQSPFSSSTTFNGGLTPKEAAQLWNRLSPTEGLSGSAPLKD